MFKGSIPALITPFKNGEIDWNAFDKMIEWHIDQGSHGIVPCGTTGESPTLTHDEHKAIIRRCVQVVNGRIPIIAGTGSNATAEAIELTRDAKEAGADACLSITPYYNKPTQAGIIAHYEAITSAVDLPLFLYDVPGRTVTALEIDTIETLAKIERIIGIKDATNDLSRVCQIRERTDDDFILLSGEDPTVSGFYALGGQGCISVVANVAPQKSAELYNSWQRQDLETFQALSAELAPLARDLFCESSPAPVKYAAKRLGLCEEEARLPILPATKSAQDKVNAALKHAGLI